MDDLTILNTEEPVRGDWTTFFDTGDPDWPLGVDVFNDNHMEPSFVSFDYDEALRIFHWLGDLLMKYRPDGGAYNPMAPVSA